MGRTQRYKIEVLRETGKTKTFRADPYSTAEGVADQIFDHLESRGERATIKIYDPLDGNKLKKVVNRFSRAREQAAG